MDSPGVTVLEKGRELDRYKSLDQKQRWLEEIHTKVFNSTL